MSGHQYIKSTSPFDNDDDVDDETFLKNARRPKVQQNSFDQQVLSFAERKKQIEERTIKSAEGSIGILRESEQIGIATAEELIRQREKLEKTDKQLDEINATLRFSQKHINGIKSVFSSLKNYMSGRNEQSPMTSSTTTPSTVKQSTSNQNFEEKLDTYDRYENHPSTRLREQADYQLPSQTSASKDFSARLDATMKEMSDNVSRLKGLAFELNNEIETQNDLIDTISDKTEQADLTINRQNKDIKNLLKK